MFSSNRIEFCCVSESWMIRYRKTIHKKSCYVRGLTSFLKSFHLKKSICDYQKLLVSASTNRWCSTKYWNCLPTYQESIFGSAYSFRRSNLDHRLSWSLIKVINMKVTLLIKSALVVRSYMVWKIPETMSAFLDFQLFDSRLYRPMSVFL